MNHTSPLIVGLSGPTLLPEEAAAIQQLNPAGIILMKRNGSPEEAKRLIKTIKTLLKNDNLLVAVDQEGGRVKRFQLNHDAPAARTLGKIYEDHPENGIEAARLNAFLLAHELYEIGVNLNTLPVADVLTKGAHEGVVGDRAFSANPQAVAALCGAAISGSLAGGVWPCIKHAPGHGRAKVDSHEELPIVDASARDLRLKDFIPFELNNMCPFTMTAHIRYTAIDKNQPASQSDKMHNILRTQLGINGLIITDDLTMNALDGTITERIEKSLNAGADLALYCATDPFKKEWCPEAIQLYNELAGKFTMPEATQKRLTSLPPRPEADLGTVAEAEKRLEELL